MEDDMSRIDLKIQKSGGSSNIGKTLKYLKRPLNTLGIRNQIGFTLIGNTLQLCLCRNSLKGSQVVEAESFNLESEQTSGWGRMTETLIQVLTEYIERKNLKRARINIALTGQDIGFRRITLPKLPPNELSSAVTWESKTLFPFDVSEYFIHYQVVGRVFNDYGEKLRLNVTAINSDVGETFYRKFGEANLKIGQINCLPAYLSLIPYPVLAPAGDRRHIVLYLDENLSVAAFIHNRQPDFYQEFTARPTGGEGKNPAIENIAAITTEMESFLDLYNARDGEKPIDGILLCGKFGGNQATVEAIAEAARLPCRALNETRWLENISAAISPCQANDSIAAAVAALAPSDNHTFIPDWYRKSREHKKFITRILCAAGLALAALGTIQYGDLTTEMSLGRQLNATQTGITEIEKSDSYQFYSALSSQREKYMAAHHETAEIPKSHFHLLMKELSLTIPDDLTLTSVTLHRQDQRTYVTLDGYVRLRKFSPEIVLAQYVETLGNSPFFGNVEVIAHNKRQELGEMDLSFQLRMDARV